MTKKTATPKHPTTGRSLKVGQLVHIDASRVLGPSAIGGFIIRELDADGSILGEPTADMGNNRRVRFRPEDITA